MTRFLMATAILLALVVGAPVAFAAEFEKDDNGNGIPDSQETKVGKLVPLGHPISTKASSWSECYLGQLQVRLSVVACPERPAGQSWHVSSEWTSLMNTTTREDVRGGMVVIPSFGGVFDIKKGRYVQVEDGLCGVESGTAWKDHVALGKTEIRADAPPFWADCAFVKAMIVDGNGNASSSHPTSRKEIKLLIANNQAKITELKSQPSGSGSNAAEVAEEVAELEALRVQLLIALEAAGDFDGLTDEVGHLAGRVWDLENAPKVEAGSTVVVRETTTVVRESKGRFYLEVGAIAHIEDWEMRLPGGVQLDIDPTIRGTLGLGPEYHGDVLILRGVVFGGVHSGDGFVVGARLDAFVGLPFARWLRVGGSIGVHADWYHVIPTARAANVIFDTSFGARGDLMGGVSIVGGRLSISVTGGISAGYTYPWLNGKTIPLGVGSPQFEAKFGLSF